MSGKNIYCTLVDRISIFPPNFHVFLKSVILLHEILLCPSFFVLCMISGLRRSKGELAALLHIMQRGVVILYLGFLGP